MELRHLRYFLAVAEEGHFSRAAEKLHIVQSALSMQIRALEEELETPLFTRTSRKVVLTEAGEILVVEAQRTLGQAQRAKEVVQQSARGETGSVRIGFSGNASFGGKLAGDIRTFRRSFPKVDLKLQEASPQQQEEAILAGELDVGYCPTFDMAFHMDLRADPIGTWPWVVAMTGSHSLAKRRSVRRIDLVNETFVVYAASGADNRQIDLLRQILEKEPAISHSASTTLTVLTLASAGLGLALVPAPLAGVNLVDLEYRPLSDVSATVDLVLLSRKRETAGGVRQFLSHAKN